MEYNKQILEILTEVGDGGISVKNLATHLYNKNTTLFYKPDYDDIYKYVRRFLQSKSRTPNNIIEKTGRWGYYRLNGKSLGKLGFCAFDFPEVDDEPESDNNKEADSFLYPGLFD